MKIYFDTSVLVTALVDQLPHHDSALACLVSVCRGHEAVTSTHALAETYATLTALPLPRRIQPGDARAMISGGLSKKLTVLPLAARLYKRAMERVANRGLVRFVQTCRCAAGWKLNPA